MLYKNPHYEAPEAQLLVVRVEHSFLDSYTIPPVTEEEEEW